MYVYLLASFKYQASSWVTSLGSNPHPTYHHYNIIRPLGNIENIIRNDNDDDDNSNNKVLGNTVLGTS